MDIRQEPPTSDVDTIVVLAAGAGTRMRSVKPKVLHTIGGRPLLWHALKAATELEPEHLVAVIGHEREQVGKYLLQEHPQVSQVIQYEQLGTGHAVACALDGRTDIIGTVLVTCGDVPLLTSETLRKLLAAHQASRNAVTVLTAVVVDPTGYGRIVRDDSGLVAAIVEHKDASADLLAIREINSGVYAFDGVVLAGALTRLTSANAQGERYLTDVLAVARADGQRVGAMVADDPAETEGVNDRVQLSELSRVLNARIVRRAQLDGVTVIDPATTWIHADVQIGRDTELLPGTSLESGTQIGTGCVIGPDTTLSACFVSDGAAVIRSHCSGVWIGPDANVGPFSYLRPGTELGASSKVGAFVEIKKSRLGTHAKVPHLSYIGDAQIGAGANLGAGSITANYDGKVKSLTIIAENAFIGSHSTLVAPVKVGAGAYVAAGSTVVGDVEAGDLAIARGRQHAVKGWVLSRRAGTKSERSARAAGAVDQQRTIPPVVEGDLPA
jgi:bifunctional UDP-N-acetylglucosamine pyrophosphorylase/glucosamine-1-phosphate N-acetyltransferase